MQKLEDRLNRNGNWRRSMLGLILFW